MECQGEQHVSKSWAGGLGNQVLEELLESDHVLQICHLIDGFAGFWIGLRAGLLLVNSRFRGKID